MKNLLVLFISSFLIACAFNPANNPVVKAHNSQMDAAKKPTRAVYKVHPDGSTNLTFGVWAGEPGETAASEEYQQKIFNYFEENCNMKRSNLKEVRVVRHNPPVWYEVWVFHDENSPRQDKTFGRSVVYEYLPEKNWTNLYIIDECKSQ